VPNQFSNVGGLNARHVSLARLTPVSLACAARKDLGVLKSWMPLHLYVARHHWRVLDVVLPAKRVSSPMTARCVCEIDTADMADGGSGHADTINSYPTRAACGADLRDHAILLMK
jgi:hypothetical protein